MEQITVVIGDRLGKGQKVAAGAEKAGARAVVVPGVAADMKLGDMMKAENATFGISFCGSGGAGAITAQNKHGYKAKYGMRSVDEGVTADDQAAHRVQIQRFDAALRGGNQLIVGFEACRAAWQLAILITKGGDVGIVVAGLVGDDDVADFQRRRQSACGAGVDNHVRLANLQQQGRAHRRRHFANA